MADTTLFFNGINAATGEPALPPMAVADFARAVAVPPGDPRRGPELGERLRALAGKNLGTMAGVDRAALSSAGWGVILPPGLDPAIAAALEPLLSWREEQAGAELACRFRRIAFQPDTDAKRWRFLARHEVGHGPANPDKLPYYLLIVGGPETIPWSFQIDLDIEYAVGRLDLATPADYARYVEAVVRAEKGGGAAQPKASFFGVRNPGDRATELSHDFLLEPLRTAIEEGAIALPPSFELEALCDGGATKENLQALLGAGRVPALWMSASHGLCCDRQDPHQRLRQGALVCQRRAGREAREARPLTNDVIFAGDDVAADADLSGLVALLYACYGGGTPQQPAFARAAGEAQAEADFTAHLPRRLLAQGAGAVIAHLDQVWAYSYLGLAGGERPETFMSLLSHLFAGHPVGWATEDMNLRYASMEHELRQERDAMEQEGKALDEDEFCRLWTATHDARGYLVLGDPAVRLPHTGAPPGA